MVLLAVSAHKYSRPLTKVQFYVHEKLNLGNKILDLQGLKFRYPRSLPNQSYDLNDVQEILGRDCDNIHHPLEYKRSDDKTMGNKIENRLDLSDPLPGKQAATLATTATSAEKDRRLCNAAAMHQGVALYEKLLSGPHLL